MLFPLFTDFLVFVVGSREKRTRGPRVGGRRGVNWFRVLVGGRAGGRGGRCCIHSGGGYREPAVDALYKYAIIELCHKRETVSIRRTNDRKEETRRRVPYPFAICCTPPQLSHATRVVGRSFSNHPRKPSLFLSGLQRVYRSTSPQADRPRPSSHLPVVKTTSPIQLR